jgi:hypothetical protein
MAELAVHRVPTSAMRRASVPRISGVTVLAIAPLRPSLAPGGDAMADDAGIGLDRNEDDRPVDARSIQAP